MQTWKLSSTEQASCSHRHSHTVTGRVNSLLGQGAAMRLGRYPSHRTNIPKKGTSMPMAPEPGKCA
eukprot:3605887-Pleurochrysis_carterae.AAC.1